MNGPRGISAPAHDDWHDSPRAVPVRTLFEPEEIGPPISGQRAYPANDDQQSIGQILRALQNRPPRTLLFRRRDLFRRLDRRLPGAVLGLSRRRERRARPQPLADGDPDRAWHGGAAADHLLLRRGAHGLAFTGTAADRAIDGAGRDAARRAGKRRARIDRHGRTGDPPRSRRHGRRRRAGAGAGERTRSDGAQRSGGARTHLQRQRGAHSRPVAGSRQPARHAGRASRAGAVRHQQRAHRSDAGFIDHQRSRRPAGQRGGRTHHPFARRKGRAHHGGAGADRRQYDPAAQRARRRPDRAPGRRQRRDRARAGDRQRSAHHQPQFQDRSHQRGILRDRPRPGRHDVGAARQRDRQLLGEVARRGRHDGRPLAGTHRRDRQHLEPACRNVRGARRGGQLDAQGVRRIDRPRPQSARRRRRQEARSGRRACRRDH